MSVPKPTSLPSVVVAAAVFHSSQRPLTSSPVRSVSLSAVCMTSGIQSTSIASMSLSPEPAASLLK